MSFKVAIVTSGLGLRGQPVEVTSLKELCAIISTNDSDIDLFLFDDKYRFQFDLSTEDTVDDMRECGKTPHQYYSYRSNDEWRSLSHPAQIILKSLLNSRILKS